MRGAQGPELYVQLKPSLTFADATVNVSFPATPPPLPTPPWWDVPTVLEAVPGNPFAMHIVYDKTNEPLPNETVPESASTLAYAALALAGLGATSRRLKPRGSS